MVGIKEVKKILDGYQVDATVEDISSDDQRDAFQSAHEDARYAAVYESGSGAAWDCFVAKLPAKCAVGVIGSTRVKGSNLVAHSLWYAEIK
jgi:hypothetical protein